MSTSLQIYNDQNLILSSGNMLKTLENRDQREKEYLLASLTKSLLPQPGIPSLEDEATVHAVAEDQLLHEIQTALKLDPNDQSIQAKTKVFEFLSNEMSKSLQSGERIDQAKTRLGQKGYLPESRYRIEFRDSFRETENLDIRRSHVKDTLKIPDQVQHLRPEISHREDFPAISIYLKSPNVRQQAHRFTLLVITERKGDTQIILSAWRVYHSDVDVSEISEPLV